MNEVLQKDFNTNQLYFKRIIDYIIKRYAIVRYIILMPSITRLPISNAKYLDLATPVPPDVGIEANHISDGYKDISIPVPTAADVNIPIPSAKDAVIPD